MIPPPKPPYLLYSTVDRFVLNRNMSIALIPAPNWAEKCLYVDPYAANCHRPGWNGELVFLVGQILNWTMRFIPASGYGYPGLVTPKQDTIFELLTSGRADVSGTPLILTENRATALPHSYPMFVFNYVFVTSDFADDLLNFQLLQPFHWDLWLLIFATILGGFFFHMFTKKFARTSWPKRLHSGILLLFLEVFLAWYPSLLAVDMIMQKEPPPPFKDANELAEQIIAKKRRFVYQLESHGSFVEVIHPVDFKGIPLYDKLLEAYRVNPPLHVESTHPFAVARALLQDRSLVYVDVEPLSMQTKHMMCTATVVKDYSLPVTYLSLFMSPRFRGQTIPNIERLSELLEMVTPGYMQRFEQFCSSGSLERRFAAKQPIKVDVWKFQSVGWFMATGFAVSGAVWIGEFLYFRLAAEGKSRKYSKASTVVGNGEVKPDWWRIPPTLQSEVFNRYPDIAQTYWRKLGTERSYSKFSPGKSTP